MSFHIDLFKFKDLSDMHVVHRHLVNYVCLHN
jgi:hypothetical protein